MLLLAVEASGADTPNEKSPAGFATRPTPSTPTNLATGVLSLK